jgi:hypothetical protein
MTKLLKTRVSVDGTWYEAGTTVPDSVAEQITNPKVWLNPEPETSDEDGDGQSDGQDGDQGSDRPRGNQSRDDWAAYATGRGIAFDENASRDEIRAAVDAADTSSEG